MTDDTLLRRIQALQYHDRTTAEALLLYFIRDTFPALDVNAVELRPSAVSLNSFNGYLTLTDGGQLFFKTHVEPDSVIGEYYNAALLAEAGYPVIRPRYASTEYGKQFLIYDRIDSPSVFDVARQIETDVTPARAYGDLVAAQHAADNRLFEIYVNSLADQSAEEAVRAPVHQLFHHRLMGGRYHAFYETSDNDVAQSLDKRWIINGRRYRSTLRTLIAQQRVIAPARSGPSVIGHGDAHNGNVFVTDSGLVYFDPAFAGRHNPFLDLAKPLFHNVFASWMYHPVDHSQAQSLTIQHDLDMITINYDETLPDIRRMFFASKVERVLAPFVIELRRRERLPAEWRLYLKLALLCCPLLTMNLADRRRFPESTAWLGLAYAIQMGSESDGGRGMLDKALDEIEAVL
ncbi:MAG: phosphotransferase family protein [Aggregatilineales bacterium]